jgi:hypothetical protein
MTIRNQNLIHEEIKRRLNVGNVCYHSVDYLPNTKFPVYSFYGCGGWSFIQNKNYFIYRIFNKLNITWNYESLIKLGKQEKFYITKNSMISFFLVIFYFTVAPHLGA